MRPALALLGALLAAAPPAAAVQGGGRPAGVALDKRVELDLQSLYDDQELSGALRELAQAYPELLRLESLGTSRQGRELWLVTAAAAGPIEPSQRAALMVVGSRGASDAAGAEMTLFTLFDLLQNHARDPRVARALSENTLYFLPCLDPDRRAALLLDAEVGGLGACEPDRNLPTDWSPWGGRSGAYPLSEPESRALSDFLIAHPNVAVVQAFSGLPPARLERRSRRLPPEDLALYDAVLARAGEEVDEPGSLTAFPDLAPSGGSLLSYACLELGAFGFQCDVAGRDGASLPEPYEIYLLARRAYQVSLCLAGALPQLSCSAAQVSRLTSEQWLVDLAVTNRGLLPTASAQARRRGVVPPPRLEAQGGKLFSLAASLDSEAALRPVKRTGGNFSLPDVPGGGRILLRLVVGAPAESQLEASLRAPRAGVAAASVSLR